MRYEIVLHDFTSVPERSCTIVPRLIVSREGDRLCQANVYLNDLLRAQLDPDTAKPEEGEQVVRAHPINQALVAFGVARVESLAEAGGLPDNYQTAALELLVEEHDLPRLLALITTKVCSYQKQVRRDLYCTASSASDDCMTHAIDGRAAAPTSRPICAACELPPDAVICTHLSHPDVRCHATMGDRYGRFVLDALCEQGQQEIGNGADCRPGGNPCWERIIDVAPILADTVISPLTVAEELDFLDAVWRNNVTRDRLVAPGTASSVTRLAQPCGNREDLESALSAVADILKRLQISQELLPDAAKAIDKSHTLDRLTALLEERLPDDESCSRAVGAVQALRAVNQARAGVQHGNGALVASSLLKLGVGYEPGDWGANWDAIRRGIAHAFSAIRRELQVLD